MMTYYTGLLIGVLAIVVVDGSAIISGLEQPTPFKYTFRVEKLEFGNDLEKCMDCEIDGNQELPVDPDGDQGANVCEFLKQACGDKDYPDEIEDSPEMKRMFSLICDNYKYICDENEPDYLDIDQGARVCMELEKACGGEDYPDEIKDNPEMKRIFTLMCDNYKYICEENEPDYLDIDQGARVCMELEKACGGEDYPDEIKDNPEMKRMFALMCKNYEYICSKDDEEIKEPDDVFPPDGDEMCLFLKMACDTDYVDEEFKKYPETHKIYLLTCENYEHICGENDDDGDEEPKEPDDSVIPDHLKRNLTAQECKGLRMACDDEEYIDVLFKDKPEEKKIMLLYCKNYEDICGKIDFDDDDIYNESYEEMFNIDEDEDYTDDEEESGSEQEGDEDEREEEKKRYERDGGIHRTLKRRNTLAHKNVAPKLKRRATKQHLITKRERAP